VEGAARVYSLPDSSLVGPGRLLHGSRLDSILEVEKAAREAAAREAAEREAAEQAEGEGVPLETPPREVADTAGGQEGIPPSGPEALPSRDLLLLVPGLLRPDSAYYVVVTGVTNIRGVAGGGGSAPFVAPPAPEPPDSVPADSVPPEPADTIPSGEGVPPATAGNEGPGGPTGGGRRR
jgi:hypothetical protein